MDFDLTRYEAAVAQWALKDRTAARMARRVNRMRLDFVRAAFEELGFRGDDLEIRAMMFTCYYSWEKQMYRDMSQRRRRALIGKQIRFLTSK